MSYESRLENVESELKGDTGHSVREWRQYIAIFYNLMWSPGDRGAAVRDFTTASAIYEWAAINWVDVALDTTRGSFGPFQAYAAYTTEALKNPRVRQALGLLLDEQSARRAGLSSLLPEESKVVRHLLHEFGIFLGGAANPPGVVRPGFGAFRPPGPLNPSPLRKPQPPVGDYWTPIVNVIGKIALSLHKANLAKNANSPKPSPLWYLPDEVLIWMLLCYEGAGDEGVTDRAHQKNNLIKSFDEAARSGKDPTLEFDFGNLGDRRRIVLNKLGISFRDRCRYSELLIPRGVSPPWREGEAPPYK